jgi:hypothetical protein
LEQEIGRQRVARKWYLIVIVLLYVGLLASFSLNVSLLLRKPQTRLLNNEKFPGEHRDKGNVQRVMFIDRYLLKREKSAHPPFCESSLKFACHLIQLLTIRIIANDEQSSVSGLLFTTYSS